MDSTPFWLQRRAALVVVATFLLAAFCCWWSWSPAESRVHLYEDGLVERATATLYLVAAAAVWIVALRARDSGVPLKTWLALSTLFCAFGLREMDWHKAWTGTSILKVSYYLQAGPLRPRLFALLALLPIVLAVLHLLVRYARVAWAAFRRGDTLACTTVVFVCTMAATKVLDRSLNLVREVVGYRFPPEAHTLVSPFEEITELALPVLLLLGLLQFASRQMRSSPADAGQGAGRLAR